MTLWTAIAHAQTLNDPARPYEVELNAEVGFLAPVAHTVQFSNAGDELDYVRDGGQDNLFPLFRPTAAVRWRKHTFTGVWQPLDLRTTVVLDRPLQVDAVSFPAGAPIDLRYGFSFWRGSWGYRVIDTDTTELSLGLGLQIRNATIAFTSVDGSRSETNRDIGPVPLLELEVRRRFDAGTFLEAEVDGFYAPIKYLNGRDVDVVGAIADIQLRGGLELAPPTSAWLGLRYLGGGASGTGSVDGTGDGYTENWLHFLTLTVGFRLR
ncbi:MAG: hypothetical protein ABMA64_32210 [Myxococcota bacterium]